MEFISVLFILLFAVLLYRLFRHKNYPPGPTSYPFLGNSALVKKLSKEHNGLQHAFHELCKIYNSDIISLTLSGFVVVVQSEELINHVLFNEEFQGRPDNFFIRLRCLGRRSGITMTDGPHWAEQRSFAVKHLHELGLGKKRMNDLIQIQLQELFSALEHSEINSISLRKLFAKCVLNVLWEIVTGESFKRKEQQVNDLISYMEERANAFDPSGGLIAHFPFLRHICPNYIGYTLIQKLNNKFKEMIMIVIEEHKKNYNKDITRDYIDAFLHEMYATADKGASSFTDDQLIMVCLDFFIAGAQTTSSTLDFLLLHMLLNPTIQEKVQFELDNILQPGEIPNIDDRKRCPYTEAVICESQRLTPVAPVIGPRRVLRDTTLQGYFIPKESTVLLNIQVSNTNPNNWENPNKLLPERFLTEHGERIPDKRLFSFAKGKRRCPGEALAKNFTFIFFSGILHNYKVQVQDEKNPPKLRTKTGITQAPTPYIMKLTKRY